MRGLTRRGRASRALLLGTACWWALPALAETDPGVVVHTMRRGDTVWEVSSRHGVDPAQLERLNHLSDVRTLPVGLRLVLPARGRSADDPSRSVRRSLAEALWALRRARFEEALEAAELGRRAREGLPNDRESSALGAQLELVSASAELAFGRHQAALRHLASALQLEPGLRLDAATTSPKVLDLLAEARETGR